MSENFGHAMPFEILTGDANKILRGSNVRRWWSFIINLKSDLLIEPNIIQSLHDYKEVSTLDITYLIDEEDEILP